FLGAPARLTPRRRSLICADWIQLMPMRDFAAVDRYLTVAEVAELLRLNPQTVRNWIDRGELRAVRVGARRVRIRQSDLDQLVEQGMTNVVRKQPIGPAPDAEPPGSDIDEAWA